MRYVLLDRITALEPPERAAGVKCISLSDDVFADHFPGRPVMPGALVLEAMANLGGVLAEATMRSRGVEGLHAALSMADRVRFRRPVGPGDKLDLTARALRVNEDGARVEAAATCEGEAVAQAVLPFAFVRVTHPTLLARRAERLAIWLHGGLDGGLDGGE
ncbi:MAG: hypothetical protein KC620_03615 [Myxococcales bacterium]|nr:hypothetical protein [Myxococcales bacterium]